MCFVCKNILLNHFWSKCTLSKHEKTNDCCRVWKSKNNLYSLTKHLNFKKNLNFFGSWKKFVCFPFQQKKKHDLEAQEP